MLRTFSCAVLAEDSPKITFFTERREPSTVVEGSESSPQKEITRKGNAPGVRERFGDASTDRKIIRFFYKVIAEKRQHEWITWFEHDNQNSVSDKSLTVAIHRLLDLVGEGQFDADAIVTFNGSRNDHRELLVPRR